MSLAPALATSASTGNLAGLVARVTFHDEENGFCVPRLKARGQCDLVTVLKAQGSECPAMVIPVTTQHTAMLARDLLYTGVRRGKRLVALVGQRKVTAMAVRNGGQRRRWSKLSERLVTARRDRSLRPVQHACSRADMVLKREH